MLRMTLFWLFFLAVAAGNVYLGYRTYGALRRGRVTGGKAGAEPSRPAG
jgi:hypothetical protein